MRPLWEHAGAPSGTVLILHVRVEYLLKMHRRRKRAASRSHADELVPLNTPTVTLDADVVLAQLRHYGAPSAFIAHVELLIPQVASLPVVEHVEFFSGDAAVTLSHQNRGRIAVPYEKKRDAVRENMLTELGYNYAVELALRVEPGGAALLAPVCSSWVFMNQGTAGRNIANPLGNVWSSTVRSANCLVARTVLLCMLLTCRGVFWVLEQPNGSLMQHHPYFQWMLSMIRVYRHAISMREYGAPSAKPTWLYSAHACVADVDRYACATRAVDDVALVTKYTDRAGKVRCSGGPRLKASQSYPAQFGQAICETYMQNAWAIKAAARERASFWSAEIAAGVSHGMN